MDLKAALERRLGLIEDTDPRELDLGDASITENTRFSYPLSCNPNVANGARGEPLPRCLAQRPDQLSNERGRSPAWNQQTKL